MTGVGVTRWVVAGLIVAAACGPAIDVEPASSGGSSGGVGMQPEGSQMYAPCESADECSPLEFCVFPSGEQGYCSDACGPDADPSPCDPTPGSGASASCLDIGIPDGRLVCALDCADGPCPTPMTCEGVETPAGARQICF